MKNVEWMCHWHRQRPDVTIRHLIDRIAHALSFALVAPRCIPQDDIRHSLDDNIQRRHRFHVSVLFKVSIIEAFFKLLISFMEQEAGGTLRMLKLEWLNDSYSGLVAKIVGVPDHLLCPLDSS